MTGRWRNRIVSIGEEDAGELLANPMNFRIHPREQQEILSGSLGEVGWVGNVIVNLRECDGWGVGDRGVKTVIDGHLRVMLALRNGGGKVPVEYVDLTPQEERIVLATYDRIAAMAGVDDEKLSELLAGLEYVEDEKLREMLEEMKVEANIAYNAPDPSEQEEPEYAGTHVIEIVCNDDDLDEFKGTLELWAMRDSVTVSIG